VRQNTRYAAGASVLPPAVPPKTPIQITLTMVGMTITQKTNSRTVRPRDTRAMNLPMNGDQEIHQAQ